MGGTKKKTITQAEKAQLLAERKKQQQEGRPRQQQERKDREERMRSRGEFYSIPKLDEKQVEKVLGPLKAITIYNAAKALGISASAANVLLRSLESKGILKKVSGYSGHYVYALA